MPIFGMPSSRNSLFAFEPEAVKAEGPETSHGFSAPGSPVYWMPGDNVRNTYGLRPINGSSVRTCVLTVVPSAPVSVRRTAASPVTVTLSATSPSVSVTSMVVVSPVCNSTESSRKRLKPVCSASSR